MPEIPENAPKPQDHKPRKSAAARKAEADGYVLINQCGVTLKIPVGENLSMRALLRANGLNDDLSEIEDSDDKMKAELMGAREMLGPEQWEGFMAANPRVADLNELFAKIREATGE